MTTVDQSRPQPTVGKPPSLANRAQSVLVGGGKFDADEFVSNLKAGALGNVPSEALFDNQKYKLGKRTASEYAAGVLTKSVTFVGWVVASGLTAAALNGAAKTVFRGVPVPGLVAGVGRFVSTAAGMTAGMLGYELTNRSFGYPMVRELAKRIPEKGAKAIADPFVRFVGDPAHKYLGKPIENAMGWVAKNPLKALGVIGLLALKAPRAVAGFLSFVGTMFVIAPIGSRAIGSKFDKVLPKYDINF